jgi:tRNA dimethylallyltransferase
MTPRIWLIGGPTASGKSGLALRLAQSLDADGGAEIIGADSMQIYADLPVLTAAPTAQERAQVSHHVVGIADAAEAWSVGRWLAAATAALDAINARGRHAIIVGGTGLYFNALTRGLTPTPEVSSDQRDASTAQLADQGEAAFRQHLAGLDPAAAARIESGDRQRLIRAHAVAVSSGRSLTDWQAETRPVLATGSYRAVTLLPPREVLYSRCDARLLRMIEDGALDEVRALALRGLDPALPALKAVGYRELAAHLAGQTSLEDAIAQAQMQTRRYAKRQGTWFRNQAPDWPAIAEEGDKPQWMSLTHIISTI